jgi:site-specific recombinase XerD
MMEKDLEQYLEYLASLNSSHSRIDGMQHAGIRLIHYLKEVCKIETWTQATEAHLVGFEYYLEQQYYEKHQREISQNSLQRWVSCMRSIFKRLQQQQIILYNPAEVIRLPKVTDQIPHFLTQDQIVKIIEAPDISKATGLRDRAIMETMYATAIRLNETAKLDIYDVDLSQQELKVRAGKGNKQRMVPLTENACYWLAKYMQEARPELSVRKLVKIDLPPTNALFLSKYCTRLVSGTIYLSIKQYARQVGLKATTHTFRHSCATHLLSNGARIEDIRLLLGHEDIYSTQIYAHVLTDDLRNLLNRINKVD